MSTTDGFLIQTTLWPQGMGSALSISAAQPMPCAGPTGTCMDIQHPITLLPITLIPSLNSTSPVLLGFPPQPLQDCRGMPGGRGGTHWVGERSCR